MRNLFALYFLLFTLISQAQSNFVWTGVVKVDSSLSQKELYSRAKLYIAKAYVSNKAVTQLNDDASCSIVIKAVHQVRPLAYNVATMLNEIPAGYVHYTLTLEIKDGRYRYTIDNCYHEGTKPNTGCGMLTADEPALKPFYGGLKKDFWNDDLKPDFKKAVNELLAEIQSNMSRKSDKSDW